MIYVVEDEEDIRELECYALTREGYENKGFKNSTDFYAACKEETPELVLLDVMLPDENGFQILDRLRRQEHDQQIPVIMVTARDSEIDKVKGLDAGADDYIAKPFGVMELIARVNALLRRTRRYADNAVYTCGDLSLDTEKRQVTILKDPCSLTYKEFELLKFLMANRGIVLSRDQIMTQVWGFDFTGETRTVDMHIKTLRQKLGAYGSLIQTVRNIGYKIDC